MLFCPFYGVPPERLCSDLRHQARREVHRRLTHGLSAEQRKALDELLQRREDTGQNWLTWLRQMPQAAKPSAMLGLIARLEHVRAIGIEPGRGHQVHQARLAQLTREAARVTVQHVIDYERQRRHATLVAIGLDLGTVLTDQAIDLFDRLVGAMFRKAEGRHARAFQADARAINDKVRLYARVGAAVIAAHEQKQDAFEAITGVIAWERFLTSVAEAEALMRPEEFDALRETSVEHYAGIRRWSACLPERPSHSRACRRPRPLMRGDRVVCARRTAKGSSAALAEVGFPPGFVRQRWAQPRVAGAAPLTGVTTNSVCCLSCAGRLQAGENLGHR